MKVFGLGFHSVFFVSALDCRFPGSIYKCDTVRLQIPHASPCVSRRLCLLLSCALRTFAHCSCQVPPVTWGHRCRMRCEQKVLDWDGNYYQCVNRCGCTGMCFFGAPHSCDAVHRDFLPFQYRHAVAGGYFDNWILPTDEELSSDRPPPVVQTAVQTPPVAPPVVPTESGRQNKNNIWGGPMRAKASTSSTSTQAPTPAQTPAAASSFPTLLRLRCDSDTAPTPTQPEQYDWQSWSWQ